MYSYAMRSRIKKITPSLPPTTPPPKKKNLFHFLNGYRYIFCLFFFLMLKTRLNIGLKSKQGIIHRYLIYKVCFWCTICQEKKKENHTNARRCFHFEIGVFRLCHWIADVFNFCPKNISKVQNNTNMMSFAS